MYLPVIRHNVSHNSPDGLPEVDKLTELFGMGKYIFSSGIAIEVVYDTLLLAAEAIHVDLVGIQPFTFPINDVS